MSTFWIIHPPKIATRDPLMGGDPIRVEVPVARGKNLHLYFHDLHLNLLRASCRLSLDPQNTALRTSYIPKAGDVIRMSRVKSLG